MVIPQKIIELAANENVDHNYEKRGIEKIIKNKSSWKCFKGCVNLTQYSPFVVTD